MDQLKATFRYTSASANYTRDSSYDCHEVVAMLVKSWMVASLSSRRGREARVTEYETGLSTADVIYERNSGHR
jgi:hypothetical protein